MSLDSLRLPSILVEGEEWNENRAGAQPPPTQIEAMEPSEQALGFVGLEIAGMAILEASAQESEVGVENESHVSGTFLVMKVDTLVGFRYGLDASFKKRPDKPDQPKQQYRKHSQNPREDGWNQPSGICSGDQHKRP